MHHQDWSRGNVALLTALQRRRVAARRLDGRERGGLDSLGAPAQASGSRGAPAQASSPPAAPARRELGKQRDDLHFTKWKLGEEIRTSKHSMRLDLSLIHI